MTRDKAIEAAAAALRPLWRTPDLRGFELEERAARDMVAVLEAVGLLKFADPVQEATEAAALKLLQGYMTEMRTGPAHALENKAGRITAYGAGCIIDALRENGFKLVRDPCAS